LSATGTSVSAQNAIVVRALPVFLIALLAVAFAPERRVEARQASPQKPLDVIFVGTPPDVVAAMLKMADVKPGDIVYDLGSGDGRIVIAAVKEFGAARGVGIDLDPARTAEAVANARAAGVTDRVMFLTQDLFESDFSEATVVAVYLLPQLMQRLVPGFRALKPGARIVSHNYDMGSAWRPDQTALESGSLIHLWRVPRR
jgi:SAM-dependent methyltransferase